MYTYLKFNTATKVYNILIINMEKRSSLHFYIYTIAQFYYTRIFKLNFQLHFYKD